MTPSVRTHPDWPRLLTRARAGGRAAGASVARSEFQRDHDRVLFSPPFRRLADKTQVFPLPYDDHVHTRLTHSLEVAAIGRSLGTLVGERLAAAGGAAEPGFTPVDVGFCVAAACLAHDLGNPPFGHVGEEAIQEFFRAGPPAAVWDELGPAERADFERFEGNAQTFRIVTRLERALRGHGLDLTFATLGALVKYPCNSTGVDRAGGRASRKKHGLFTADRPAFEAAAQALGLHREGDGAWRRHPLAFLSEAADDVAYNILDLEDGFRLRHVEEGLFLELLEPLRRAHPQGRDVPGRPATRAERLDRADALRAIAIDTLVGELADAFFAHQDGILDGTFDRPLTSVLPSREALEAVGRTCLERCYRARDVLKMELTGAEAIQGLLGIFTHALAEPRSLRSVHLSRLLPTLFETSLPPYERLLRLTDHLAGMTDHYAVRLYRELRGMRYPGGRD